MTKSKTKTTFQTVMTELSGAFTRAKRDGSGEKFTKLKDGSPQWMTAAIMSAHQALDGRLPDDWVYESMSALASNLEYYPSADAGREAIHEVADGCVDTSNHARATWLAAHGGNNDLIRQAREDGLISADADVMDQIGVGQYVGLLTIAETLIAAVEAESDSRDESEVES